MKLKLLDKKAINAFLKRKDFEGRVISSHGSELRAMWGKRPIIAKWDKKEKLIPKKSSLGEKNSDIFGSIKSQLTNNINLGYNFSVDNDYSSFEYNDINATFSLNNIVTKFSFIEENSEVGDTNVLTNSIMYNYDDQNYFTFKTRRNRKINLTEYYDLVYEYKNDCLTAGIKYNKTYYSDGDLKPSENLLFTITIVPLTSYEYKVDQIGN